MDTDSIRKSIAESTYSEFNKSISIRQCLIHQNTKIIGKPLLNSKICKCCGVSYQRQQLDSMFQPTDIYYLGSGFVLYFAFIKTCIVITLICTLVFSIPMMYFNYTNMSCQSSNKIVDCAINIYLLLSVANKINNTWLLKIQSYIADILIIAMFLIFQIIRKKLRNISIQAESQLDASDYAVMMRLPFKNYDKNDIIRGINQWWEIQYNQGQKKNYRNLQYWSQNFPISEVVISYELSTFAQLQTELNNLLKQSKQSKLLKKKIFDSQKQNRIKQIKSLIKQKSFLKNNKVIVVFKYPQQKQYVIKKHESNFLSAILPFCYNKIKVNGQRIKVYDAALPTQINWENHSITYKKKFCTRILVRLLCLILIISCQAGIYGLLKSWFQYKINGNKNFQQFVSPIISIAINVINLLLYQVLTIVSKYQFRSTTLELEVSITIKIIISIFLNSGIMLLGVYFFLNINSIWITNGFIQTMTFSFLMVIVLPHIFQYLNVDFIIKFFQKLKIRLFKKSSMISQKQANQAFQRAQVEMYRKYAWMINLLWWSSIFAPLIPISYPCVCISLFLHYWNQKFMYVTLLREPKPFGSYLNQQMFKLLEMTPFFLSVGNLCLNIILVQINKEGYRLTEFFFDIIAIAISLFIFIFPSESLNKFISWIFCIQKQKQIKNIDYQSASKKFITTYEMQNPLYRKFQIKKRTLATAREYYNIQPQFDTIQHPIKKYIENNGNQQQDQQFDFPFQNKINMKKSEKKIYVPNLPLKTNQQYLNDIKEFQLIKLGQIFPDEKVREKLSDKVKSNITKIN